LPRCNGDAYAPRYVVRIKPQFPAKKEGVINMSDRDFMDTRDGDQDTTKW